VQAMTSVAKFIWPIPDKGLRRRLHRCERQDARGCSAADDAFVPAIYAERVRRGDPRWPRTAVIPDAAHMAPYEQTDEVMRLIAQHLGRLTA